MSTDTVLSEKALLATKTQQKPQRVVSVDIFRGLVMVVMIFVNDLADVKGLPAWTYHMPKNVDAMSYVDMVFPEFLFAMGLSLPLALRTRLAHAGAIAEVWKHIALRAVHLMVLGLILANVAKVNRTAMPLALSPHSWGVLALLGMAAYLAVYPKSMAKSQVNFVRGMGLFLLALMLLVFRRVDKSGQVHWLSFEYWEILGIIGWTYLATSLLYIPVRSKKFAAVSLLALAILFHLLVAGHALEFANRLPLYEWPWSNGAFIVLTLAGVVTADLLLRAETRPKISVAVGFGLLLLSLGWMASPLGISKIRATPTWSLVSAGASVLLFVLLYWVCEILGKKRWALFAYPAGANTLLTYLLPDLFIFTVGMAWIPGSWTYGTPGVLRSVVFTAAMLLFSAVLTRAGVRLRL